MCPAIVYFTNREDYIPSQLQLQFDNGEFPPLISNLLLIGIVFLLFAPFNHGDDVGVPDGGKLVQPDLMSTLGETSYGRLTMENMKFLQLVDINTYSVSDV